MNNALRALTISATIMVSSVSFAEGIEDIITKRLKSANRNAEVTDVRETPINNILEVQVNHYEYIYFSSDGNYLFTGELVELTDDSFTNLTIQRKEADRSAIIANAKLDQAITFPSTTSENEEIFVFTDVSCSYCVNLHKHISEINENGITVHYFAFPRAGAGSQAAELMGDVWCTENRQAALTEAKSQGKISQKPFPCQTPLAYHYNLASQLGITGTPSIYDRQGRHLGGYLSTEQLIEALHK